MGCDKLRESFSVYKDGESESSEEIAAHLRTCSECASAYDEFCMVISELESLPSPEPPLYFHRDLMGHVKQNTRKLKKSDKRFVLGWFAGAAASTVLIAAMWFSGVFTTSVPEMATPVPVAFVEMATDMSPVAQVAPAPAAGGASVVAEDASDFAAPGLWRMSVESDSHEPEFHFNSVDAPYETVEIIDEEDVPYDVSDIPIVFFSPHDYEGEHVGIMLGESVVSESGWGWVLYILGGLLVAASFLGGIYFRFRD